MSSMSSATIEFYEKGSTSNGEYQYADIMESIANSPEFVFHLPSKPELVDIILPKIGSQLQLNEMQGLYESSDASLRYHALVMSLALRFGLKLSDPLNGTFELATPDQSVFYALSFEQDVLGTKVENDPIVPNCKAARGILMRIIESLVGAGLLQYAKFLSNAILSAFYLGKIRQRDIVLWIQQVLKATVSALECGGEKPPVAAFLSGVPAREHAIPSITSVVLQGRPEPVTVCQHGTLKRSRTIDGVKRIACVLSGLPGDCGDTQSF